MSVDGKTLLQHQAIKVSKPSFLSTTHISLVLGAVGPTDMSIWPRVICILSLHVTTLHVLAQWVAEGFQSLLKHKYFPLRVHLVGRKECVKAVYCHSAYLTYMQSTSYEMLGWLKHKLKSRLPREISLISDMQMKPPLWQKAKKN